MNVNCISCMIPPVIDMSTRLMLHFTNNTEITCKQSGVFSPKLTKLAPDNQWLEDEISFVLGWHIFRGNLSFRECILAVSFKRNDVSGRGAPFKSMEKSGSEMGGMTESPICLYTTVVQYKTNTNII